MVDYQTLTIVLTGIGLMVALIYYAMEIRNQNRTRQAELYMQLFQRDISDEFQQKAFDLYRLDFSDLEKLDERYLTDRQLAASLRSFMFYLDGIGTLMRNGLVDLEYVSQIGAGVGPIKSWEILRPWVEYYRESRNVPDYLSGFEFYANEMIRVRKQKGYDTKWSNTQKTFTE
jgi:hypothetical protein